MTVNFISKQRLGYFITDTYHVRTVRGLEESRAELVKLGKSDSAARLLKTGLTS